MGEGHPMTPMQAKKGDGSTATTTALERERGHHNPHAALPPGQSLNPLYRRLGGVGASLDGHRKSRSTRIRSLYRPACTESLYDYAIPTAR